jgi:subtilase family serine protease
MVLTLLFVLLLQPLTTSRELPDLTIKRYEFDSYNNKRVRVQIANEGKAASARCRVELSIRKVKGSAVTRTVVEEVPAIAQGKEEWITLDAGGILQSPVTLQETTFRLIVDESRAVPESNEDNNETWHN